MLLQSLFLNLANLLHFPLDSVLVLSVHCRILDCLNVQLILHLLSELVWLATFAFALLFSVAREETWKALISDFLHVSLLSLDL